LAQHERVPAHLDQRGKQEVPPRPPARLELRLHLSSAHAENASLSSAGSLCAARPTANPSARNVVISDDPPVENNGSVIPVIGISPRFTLTLIMKCAAKYIAIPPAASRE